MEDIIKYMVDLISFFAKSNPLIFYGGLAILAFLIYQRPKFVLITVFLALLVAGVVYIIMDMASSGVARKEHMIRRDAPIENVFRLSGSRN